MLRDIGFKTSEYKLKFKMCLLEDWMTLINEFSKIKENYENY